MRSWAAASSLHIDTRCKLPVKVRCQRNRGSLVRQSSLLLLLLLFSKSCLAQSANDTDPERTETTIPLGPCPVCVGGEPMPLSEKPLSLGNLPFTTCGELASFAAFLVGGTDDCTYLQSLGSYCGCTKPSNACSFCPNGDPVTRPEANLDLSSGVSPPLPEPFESIAFDSISCEIAESLVGSNLVALLDVGEPIFCLMMQFRSNLCGCKPDWSQIVVPWSYRISGILSTLGSTLIIVDVLKKKKSKRFTMYHQLVLGMSFFDIISSAMAILSTVMVPIDVGLYQAKGNNATCKAQGALFVLGQTSIFYNMSLSIYFWLVICRNWKEHQFRKLRLWIHVVICSVGTALALSAIPYVGPALSGCDVLIPPGTATLWPATIFYIIPLCFVAVVLSVATAATCHGVYRQQKKAQRWMADRSMELSRRVFWQSFWYVLAFCVAMPWVLVTFYVEFRSSTHLLVHYISLGLVAPSQGLLNSLVYFRRQRAKGGNLCFGFGFGGTPVKKQPPDTPTGRRGGREGIWNDQSLVGGPPDNATAQDNGGKPSDTKGQENEETSGDGVSGDEQPCPDSQDLGEGLRGVSGDEPHREVEFSAVAEYWKLNEESTLLMQPHR